MRKLNGYYVSKVNSGWIIKNKYSVNRDFETLVKNGQIVRVGENQLSDFILEFRETTFDIEELSRKKREIQKRKSNARNKDKLKKVLENINKQMYLHEIINVEFDDSRHYEKIQKNNGFEFNGFRFVRLLSGAGQVRRKTITYIREDLKEDILEKLHCGIDFAKYPIIPAKYNAYLALCTSASYKVTFPRIAVIADYEIERDFDLLMMYEREHGVDPELVLEKRKEKINVFDGQGIVSNTMAKQWAEDLDIDYTPSVFIVRSAWLKGTLVSMEFHKFAQENKVDSFIDIYGNPVDINEVDVIVSESQFKLAKAYLSRNHYIENINNFGFSFRISRITPKENKKYANLTYQYIQAIKWEKDYLEKMAKPTLDWLGGLHYDQSSILEFVLGSLPEEPNQEWFSRITDPYSKSLLIEPHLLNNKKYKQHFYRYFRNKIHESFQGILRCNGNYQFLQVDPVAQLEWAFGLMVKGCLKSGENFIDFWNEKGIDKVTCLRSPMTGRSEKVTLKMCYKEELAHLSSGIFMNMYDDTPMRLSGSDNDGDIALTTDMFVEIEGDKIMVSYEKNKPEKRIISDEICWKADLDGFGTKIGLLTNWSTTLYTLYDLYPEYRDLIDSRLKMCVAYQSQQIDQAKGLRIFKLPDWWAKFNKTKGMEDNPDYLASAKINNDLLLDKRPYFMRYVYSHLNRDYNSTIEKQNNYFISKFGKSSLNRNSDNEEELSAIRYYDRMNPLIDSNDGMNAVCHYMEDKTKDIKISGKSAEFDWVDIFPNQKVNFNKMEKIKNIYREIHSSNDEDTPKEVVKIQLSCVTSNMSELLYLSFLVDVSKTLQYLDDEFIEYLLERNNNEISIKGEAYIL